MKPCLVFNGERKSKKTAVTIKSYRYCRILIAILFFSFALRSLHYFQAQKKPAICRRLPRPRYIWTFLLCTPFPILYQSQASLLANNFSFFWIEYFGHKIDNGSRSKVLSEFSTESCAKELFKCNTLDIVLCVRKIEILKLF